MWLIVGLGNPGAKYLLTRHNIGFIAIDAYAKSVGAPDYKSEHKAQTSKFKIDGEDILLCKPQTYMNLSGESVSPLMQYYKVDKDKLLVLHDEIDLPFAQMKMQKNRGPGGHNGLKSINEQLGHQDYARIKLGVGRPSDPRIPVVDYVLQNFSQSEQTHLPSFINRAADAIESFIFDGFTKAANHFNQKHVET